MKAILLSVKPKWVEKILNGEKTIEIRKVMPKCELPIDVYIYMTKYDNNFNSDWDLYCALRPMQKHFKHCLETCFGKVVAKFTLNKVEFFTTANFDCIKEIPIATPIENIINKTCLSEKELSDYEFSNHEDDTINYFGLYAWHIDNLVIFDKPKELKDFYIKSTQNDIENGRYDFVDMTNNFYKTLTKAPQSYCYVEVEE